MVDRVEEQVITQVITQVDDGESKFKEFDISLNTAQSGISSYITDKIKGEIQALIIDTDNRVQIDISFEEFPEIKLFACPDFYGSEYICLRSIAISNEHEKFNYVGSKFYLNDKLKITISGPYNANARFIIRYCSEE